jgi:hypothetical protein
VGHDRPIWVQGPARHGGEGLNTVHIYTYSVYIFMDGQYISSQTLNQTPLPPSPPSPEV